MKIKEKVKGFVKEHKAELAIVGASIGCGAFYIIGYGIGQKKIFDAFKEHANIDLTKEFVCNVKDVVVKDVLGGDPIPEGMIEAGITNLEDTIKTVVLAQKK